MPKTGKTHFHLRGGRERVQLRKGGGHSQADIKKEIMRTVFALRFMGRSDDEIIEHLEGKYGALE